MKKVLKPLFALGMVAVLAGCAGEKMISVDFTTFQGAVAGIISNFDNIDLDDLDKTNICMKGKMSEGFDYEYQRIELEERCELDLKAQAMKLSYKKVEEAYDGLSEPINETKDFEQWVMYVPETGIVSVEISEGTNFYRSRLSDAEIDSLAAAAEIERDDFIKVTIGNSFLSMASSVMFGGGFEEFILISSSEQEFVNSCFDVDVKIEKCEMKVGNKKASVDAKVSKQMAQYNFGETVATMNGFVKAEYEDWHLNSIKMELKGKGIDFVDSSLNYEEVTEEMVADYTFNKKADLSKKPDISKMIYVTAL